MQQEVKNMKNEEIRKQDKNKNENKTPGEKTPDVKTPGEEILRERLMALAEDSWSGKRRPPAA